MGLSRRFQNLIVYSPYVGAKWLRRVDLTGQLFGNTATQQPTIGDESESAVVQDSTYQSPAADSCDWKDEQAAAVAVTLKMEMLQLSSPIFRFGATDGPSPDEIALGCFPLSDGRVVLADHTRRAFLCNADKRYVVTMPNLHKEKTRPISLFVPSADADDNPNGGGGSLYVMERIPKPVKGGCTQPSDQFEAFVCSKRSGTLDGPWHCQLLPQPPFIYNPTIQFTYPRIVSYAVVGSNICISTKCNGTYCLDTASNTWEISSAMLPFYGKVEYVPELKLWFGLSAESRQLAVADLSMDSQPQLIDGCKEYEPPDGWLEYQDSQLVNLGCGRFCIVRFFETMSMDGEEIVDSIAVFTGVEVMPAMHYGNCSGKGNLRMIRHKSRCHLINDTSIHAVF